MSREFWIYRNHSGYLVRESPLEPNYEYPVMFHVREVNPALDKAIEGLVEALKFYSDFSNYEVDNMVSHDHEITCYHPMNKPIQDIAKEALAAYKAAKEGK